MLTLRAAKELNKNTKILALAPFIDERGILFVGSRLRHTDIPYTQKHPILLPKNAHVTQLII